MRKILLLLVFFACSSKEKIEPPPSPTVVDEKTEWIVYEGILKTQFGEGPAELSLMQTEIGQTSNLRLTGSFIEGQKFLHAMGRYTILYGAANQEIIIQAHCTASFFSKSAKERIRQNHKPGKGTSEIIKPEILELDLSFKSDGMFKLVQVDEDFERISEDNRYTLFKRLRLFTVEGYVTLENTHTEFFEQNTRENWLVAPIGNHAEVQHVYDSLVTEKSEGMYLKALAYSIGSDSTFIEPRVNFGTGGVGDELLVIKRILEMKKSEAYKNKEQASGLGYN
jgi:hypothetical protein